MKQNPIIITIVYYPTRWILDLTWYANVDDQASLTISNISIKANNY